MKKCCFISVYFGKIPRFFKPFLDSCRWNETFNWLMIHDEDIPYELPKNVGEVTMDMKKFQQLVFEKIGVKISDIKPYKICDFRPAFGVIFEDYLKDYEFWGICDTDLLLGDLKAFITEDLFQQYDKIFTMGHMSIIRNNKICNNLFYSATPHSRDYKDVFTTPKNCVYDEFMGFTEKFVDRGLPVYEKKVCADVWCDSQRIRICERWLTRLIQPYNRFLHCCTDKNNTHQIFILDRGKVFKVFFDKRRLKFQEYSYIHKLEYPFERPLDLSTQLIITAQGYVEDDTIFEHIDRKTITKTEMDMVNKKNLFFEWKRNGYLFLLWNYRNMRQKVYENINREF